MGRFINAFIGNNKRTLMEIGWWCVVFAIVGTGWWIYCMASGKPFDLVDIAIGMVIGSALARFGFGMRMER